MTRGAYFIPSIKTDCIIDVDEQYVTEKDHLTWPTPIHSIVSSLSLNGAALHHKHGKQEVFVLKTTWNGCCAG